MSSKASRPDGALRAFGEPVSFLLAVFGLVLAGSAGAQTSAPPAAGAPTPAVPTTPSSPTMTLIGVCEGDPPEAPGPCQIYRCTNGAWTLAWRATGSACNDGNACTYNTTCNASHACTGGGTVTCSASLCQACNNTSSCVAAPSGTVCRVANGANVCDKAETCSGTAMSCPADGAQGWATGSCSTVPGLHDACACNTTGVCANSSANVVTGVCWDDRGNMSGKYVTPSAASCQLTCPSP